MFHLYGMICCPDTRTTSHISRLICRSACDDVNDYLDVPVPLTGDTTIGLDVEAIECPVSAEEDDLDEIIVSGGALTISASTAVRCDCASSFQPLVRIEARPTSTASGGTAV